MNKGILFSITALILAFSIISLTSNYRLFLSEIEQERLQSPDIQTQFLYVGYSFSRIIDVGFNIQNVNSTTTILNTTDRLPRTNNFSDALTAYESLINTHLKSGHDISSNFSTFKNNNFINFTGINMQYIWGNSLKSNLTINFSSSGNNSFIKGIIINIANLTSNALPLTDTSTTSGDLALTVKNQSSTVFFGSVDRTRVNTFNFSASNGNWVNLTVGSVSGQNSSIRVVPQEKIYFNTSLTINQGELP